MWFWRATLAATLPRTKQNHPKPDDLKRRDRVLGWVADCVVDFDWFVQKSFARYLRKPSKPSPDRAVAVLTAHGGGLQPFTRRSASKDLRDQLA
ncbi:MAG: DNA alkylation repair protein [Pseudomonadota bacterium]